MPAAQNLLLHDDNEVAVREMVAAQVPYLHEGSAYGAAGKGGDGGGASDASSAAEEDLFETRLQDEDVFAT